MLTYNNSFRGGSRTTHESRYQLRKGGASLKNYGIKGVPLNSQDSGQDPLKLLSVPTTNLKNLK